MGGTNLTNINYSTIRNVKFIITMKYYLTCLGKLASTMTEKEKKQRQILVKQFLMQHQFFSKTWLTLSQSQKTELIKIIVSGKGVIPYEKIDSINALQKQPENGTFFSEEEFFSTLKGQPVNKEDYDNSKKLFILLKMRNLSDLNDLYNVQDVILLMVIIENRFQEVQNGTGYNPRKISSASKLRCIQREQSECVLALPTNNCHVEIFEKTLSGDFSCVNTRLSFDTELLMPNLIEKDFNIMNIDQSFKAFKRDDLKLIYKERFDDQKKHEKNEL